MAIAALAEMVAVASLEAAVTLEVETQEAAIVSATDVVEA